MGSRRVLLIEDEASISEPLTEALEKEGFAVEVAGDGTGGLQALDRAEPDIVLLDLLLPDMDGRDVCKRIRAHSDVPLIMLTARGRETDRVVGLELGADDYIVKPFSSAELIARMRAVMRRSQRITQTPAEVLAVGDVALDPKTWTVTVAGETVDMPRKEFELLKLLMENAGDVMTREDIMELVWDEHWFGSTKTLDVHVSSLRKKLKDDPGDPRYIHNVRGVGFRFASPKELSS